MLLFDPGLSRLALHLDPGLFGLWRNQMIAADPVFVVSFLSEAGRCNDDIGKNWATHPGLFWDAGAKFES